MFINDLPEEILIQIFSYLTHLDLIFRVRKVCLLWKDICLSSPYWKKVDVDKELKFISRSSRTSMGIYLLRPRPQAILTNILFEINASIRDFRFNTTLVPLDSKNEGDPSLGALHCIACRILFNSFDINKTRHLAIPDSVGGSNVKIKDKQCDQNNESSEVSNELDQDEIKNATETEAVQVIDINESFSKREFDYIEIRETTSTLSFVQLNNFLSRVGKVKVLGINTTKVLVDVSKESLKNLGRIDGLELQIQFCEEADENYARDINGTFRFLFENLQNVTKLITDVLNNDALLVLLTNNRQLRHLSLRNCDDITKAAFVNMPELDNLVHLEISRCSEISDSEVEVIANCCKNLRYINLKNSDNVTHNGIRVLIEKCTQLTELHANGSTFNDLMIEMYEIQKHLHIKKLSLQFSEIYAEITDDLFKRIADVCLKIRELYLTGLHDVSSMAVIDYVLQNCSDLYILDCLGTLPIGDIDDRDKLQYSRHLMIRKIGGKFRQTYNEGYILNE